MAKYFYTARDNGDGSASIEWFESQDAIDFAESEWPEEYGAGEGGGWIEVDGGEIIADQYGGFSVTTKKQLLQRSMEDAY